MRRASSKKDSADIDGALRLLSVAIEEAVGVFTSVADSIDLERSPAIVDQFDLADAVRCFTEIDTSDPTVAAGALLARRHPSGNLLSMVLLDSEGNICTRSGGDAYGRQIIARRIGGELADRLAAGKGMIVFN